MKLFLLVMVIYAADGNEYRYVMDGPQTLSDCVRTIQQFPTLPPYAAADCEPVTEELTNVE